MHVTELWCFCFEGVWTGVPPDLKLTEGDPLKDGILRLEKLIQNKERGFVCGAQTAGFQDFKSKQA